MADKPKKLPTYKHTCGHRVNLEKMVGRGCPQCRAKASSEKRTAAKKDPPTPKPVKGRLPDRSTFRVEYDAATQTWSGLLLIHTPTGVRKLSGTKSGVFRLLAHLDDEYRKSCSSA